jgi:hypothetical protein
MPLIEKIRTICKEIYRAKDISLDKSVRDQLASFEAMGYGKFPICMTKTQYSFTTNPDAKGAPSDHIIPVREGGRRIRGRDLRRAVDHAGSAQDSRGRRYRCGVGRHDRRIILTGAEYGRIPVGFTAFLDTLEQRCRESE